MQRNLTCEGIVLHRRSEPFRHEFRYPVWMVYVDVDGLPEVGWPLFSTRTALAPLSIRAQDYPRDPKTRPPVGSRPGDMRVGNEVRASINARLVREGHQPADRVYLLTQPRSWGWMFNPVSFYFCYRGGRLASVIAEITNTPWDQVHSYVLAASSDRNARAAPGDQWDFLFPKRFHVSPFMPMDLDYRWRIRLSNDVVEIAMSLSREGRELFFAGLYLRAQPLTPQALRRGAWRYPLQNLRTLTRIYWQALRLWRRGAPFHSHPERLQEARSS